MQSPRLRRSVKKIPAGLILHQFVVDDEPIGVFREEEAVAEFRVGTCLAPKAMKLLFQPVCWESVGSVPGSERV